MLIYGKFRAVSGYYNIGGKYNTLTFKAYPIRDVTFSVYGDNENLLAEYTVKGSLVPQTCTANVQSHSQIHFQVTSTSDEDIATSTYIFDAYLQ